MNAASPRTSLSRQSFSPVAALWHGLIPLWHGLLTVPPRPTAGLRHPLTTAAALAAFTCALQFSLFPGTVRAADKPPDPVFIVQTAAGRTLQGTLRQIGRDWSLQLGGPDSSRVEGGDLLELRRQNVSLPPLPTGEQLLFTSGDRLTGQVVKLDGERLQFAARAGDGKTMSVPLSAVALLWITAPHTPEGEERPDALRRRLLTGQRTRDIVLLQNGDLVEGSLSGLDRQVVRIDAGRRNVDVPFSRVAAVATNTELAGGSRPREAYARVVLTDGCRLSLAAASLDEGRFLTGTTLFGAAVRVPLEQVVALTILQGPAVYLSDLKPRASSFTDYLGGRQSRPFVQDGTCSLRDLQLAGNTYEKGLGTCSGCRITYDLASGYRRFEALVGLDDRTGRGGAVRIQVLLDGKPQTLGLEGDLTFSNGPLPVRINVSGGKELTLVVEPGRSGPVEGQVDWAGARLVK